MEDAGKFLIEIMPVMFIPAGAGLVESWSALRPICVQVVVIMFVSTIGGYGDFGKSDTVCNSQKQKGIRE